MQLDIGYSADRVRAIQGEKVLAVIVGALGDFVNSIPSLKAIRQKHAGAHFEILMSLPNIALAEMLNLANEYQVYPLALSRFPEARENYVTAFTHVYSFLDHGFRPGQEMNRLPMTNDANDPHAKFCFEGFGFTGDWKPSIEVQAEKKFPKLIAIHSAAGTAPRWRHDRWVNACMKLSREYRILLVGSGQELPVIKAMTAPVKKERFDVAYNLPLNVLSKTLATCSGFLAHDSGPGHLCSALGLPGVVIHCRDEAHLKIWKPASDRVTVVNWKGTSNDAIEALKRLCPP